MCVCVCIVVKPTLIKTALPFHDVSSSWDSHELCVTTDNGANILKATQTQQLGQTVVLGSLPATGQWEQTSQVGHCYTGLYWNSGTITTAILYKRNSSFSFTSRRPDGAFTGQCISKQNCFFTFALSHIISSKKKTSFTFYVAAAVCCWGKSQIAALKEKLDPYFFFFFLAAPVAQVIKPVTRTTPWKFGVITAADIFLRDPWVPVLLSTVLVRSIHSPCVYLKWCKVSFWMCVSTTY